MHILSSTVWFLRMWILETRVLKLKLKLQLALVVRPLVMYLTSLCLNFVICRGEIGTISIVLFGGLNEVMQVKHLEQFLPCWKCQEIV